MKTLRKLRLRFRSLLNRSKVEEDLEAELQGYFEREVDKQIAAGASPGQARERAALELHGKELIKEECRDTRGIALLENTFRDLRYGLRVLLKNRGFFATAVLTIALGIATATTLFSVVESQLWRPLPFREPEKLVVVWERNLKQAWQQTSVSVANFKDWRQQSRTFEKMAALQWPSRRRFIADHRTERPRVSAISSGFFETLAVPPEVGRAFQARNEEPSNQTEAILTSDFARRVFGSDRNAIGKRILMDDQQYLVTGVMPPGFRLDVLQTPDVFVPLLVSNGQPRDKRDLVVLGRLRPGVARAEALADLESIARALAAQYPDTNTNFSVLVENPRESFTSASGRIWLLLLLTFSLFVLVIACFNVATLQLMRSVVRSREFALRAALGASRSAIVRQAIAESAWLVAIGAAFGVALALAALQGLRAAGLMLMVDRETDLSIDLWPVAFVVVTCALATIFFGLAPELFGSKMDLETALRASGRSASASPKIRRRLAIFSAVEVALAFLSLFGTGLFAGSYRHLEQIRLGFHPEHLSVMQISLSGTRYTEPPAVAAFYRKVADQAAAVPGAQQAELASTLPLTGGGIDVNFARADRPRPPHGQEAFSIARSVTAGYFQLLGIPILIGRPLSASDTASSPRVVVINQNLADHFFAQENPIGKQLLLLAGDQPSIPEGKVEIVGVVANARDVGLDEIPFDDIYLPASQGFPRAMYVVAKTQAFSAVAPVLRQKIQALDPEQFVAEPRRLESYVAEQLHSPGFNLSLVSVFAGLSLLLTVVALFGTLSFSVVQQTHDIGVRIAIGAQPLDVLKMISWQTFCLVIFGSTIGLAVSVVLGRLSGNRLFLVPHQHAGILYGVSTDDPLSFAFAGVMLVLFASVAALFPLIRAMRVDPNIALRCE